jgi:glycosyltransferase involved in cell wall biosynthesis
MDKTKLSICVPYFLDDNEDLTYLNELLQSIQTQSFTNYEVVLSEDAASPLKLKVEDLCGSVSESIQLRLVKSQVSGVSANANYAVSLARSKYVKIMFHDDLLANESSLYEIVKSLDSSKKKWLLSACDHFNQDSGELGPSMVPKLNKRLFNAKNTVSSPSVVAFRANSFLEFAQSLSLMMDCEWYIRMVHNFGKPIVLKSVAVINRIHSNQAQHGWKSKLAEEKNIVRSMHTKTGMRKSRCVCRS